MLWLGGAAVLLIRKITLYQSFVRYLRAGGEPVSDPALLDRLALMAAGMKIRRPVELYIAPAAPSPLLAGFFRPCVVLPSTDLSKEELDYILLHELTHCKRGDMFYKWLVQITVCFHWFNPLVWAMGREISRACELACDEAVTAGLDMEQRRCYGDTLLRALEDAEGYRRASGSVTLNEGGKLLKERLISIMDDRKRSRWIAPLSLLIAGLLLTGGAAAGAYTGPDKGPSAQNVNEPAVTTVNTGNPGGEGSGHSYQWYYCRDSYYQPSYIFDIGWNISRENAGEASRTVAFWDKARGENVPLTVCFDPSCANLAEDKKAMKSLDTLLGRIYMENRKSDIPATNFRVFAAQDVGTADVDVLAGQFYAEEKLPFFGAVFPWLTEKEQSAFLERIYKDKALSFFAAALKGMKVDASPWAERAYNDQRIEFFSVLLDYLPSDSPLFSTLAERAYNDKRISFFAVLLDYLPENSPLFSPLAESAYNDGQISFFSLLMDYLPENSDLLPILAERAYNENQISFFSVLADNLGREELAVWAGRAAADKKISFWAVLSNWAEEDDGDWEAWKTEIEARQKEAYKAYGVTFDGRDYYY